MKKRKIPLDFIVDKLTNSIENAVTKDVFQTDVSYASFNDIKGANKKAGWVFNWKYEFDQPEREVYKLTIVNNQQIIQGLVCIEVKPDHVYMHLIESAPFNKGKAKIYLGVAGNLVAYACKVSFQNGFNGFVSFASKSALIDHYIKTLEAKHYGGLLMVIDSNAAAQLLNKYYKNLLL